MKQQLRVFHDDEDLLIQGYTDAALSAFEGWTNRTLIDPAHALPDPPGNAIALSKSILQGALLLIGHWYANRETVAMGMSAIELPMATNALWNPHRWVNL
ncbi:head-tail connector protein [Pseudomonas sp. CCI3.1]|uniref:head-tail connector protein n=1 Tax=Pseudomonas sp. CCI3.1 TaxID=3048618 RepID=UPI002AB383F4|nr:MULTISPECIES: head-tail connector protein [unclassified Pseudomonas]MDY7584731.1 head-tail connector protein [Pseudomonas sp. CCI3.1]MEB0066647.1 head-tail connector protein [Pseudomonas sp. CCI3.1]MEB0071986.1 head-tail connector protein [Pseudomonas sp. CCI1.4]